MWNSYDLDQVPDLFLDDDRLTYFSSEREGIIRGMGEVMEHHRGFGFVPGGEPRGSRLWLEGLKVDRFGDMAVATGIWYFQGDQTESPGVAAQESAASQGPQRGPVTFVCVQEDNRWWFVHMNFSEYPPSQPEASGS
jgi:hypothetical protein